MNEHHGHEHPKQPDLEDQPITYYKIMTEALAELLIEKGVITADEMRKQMEQQDSRSPIFGAKLIARAWTDKDFKNPDMMGEHTEFITRLFFKSSDKESTLYQLFNHFI